MNLVIDGYNLLHVMGAMRPRLGAEGLRSVRRGLLLRLVDAVREHQVTVVFDAADAPPDVPIEELYRGIRILFARRKGEQADDVIEDLLKSDSAPKRLTVVSNDQRLSRAAKRRGATSWSCAEFLEWLDVQHRRQSPSSAEAELRDKDEGLNPNQLAHWLREFQDLDQDPTLGEPPLEFK
jgi:predicted RNA-binding protein with PIN domain